MEDEAQDFNNHDNQSTVPTSVDSDSILKSSRNSKFQYEPLRLEGFESS